MRVLPSLASWTSALMSPDEKRSPVLAPRGISEKGNSMSAVVAEGAVQVPGGRSSGGFSDDLSDICGARKVPPVTLCAGAGEAKSPGGGGGGGCGVGGCPAGVRDAGLVSCV